MQQVKIFKTLENDLSVLEKQMNKWLEESNARVSNIFGNIAPQGAPTEVSKGSISASPFVPSDVMIVVLYEKP